MTKYLAVMAVTTLMLTSTPARGAPGALTVSGTGFLLDGKPFPFTGVSFFNAIYNPAFNESEAGRRRWLEVFRRHGINVLRVWLQWDNKRGFVDSCAECSMWKPDGSLREQPLARLKALLESAGALGMAVEVTLFSQESWFDGIRVGAAESDRGVEALTRALGPHRNAAFQIWNELTERTLEMLAVIRRGDPKRVVTSSPGVAGILGDHKQNEALDYLSPHTSRQNKGRTWEVGPREIEYLLARYRKPVVDDEPARNGTNKFGGPAEATSPYDHVVQIWEVWRRGGHVVYHHDMFQTGAGTPAVPPHGIPDPTFSPYHRVVFEFLAQRARYWR